MHLVSFSDFLLYNRSYGGVIVELKRKVVIVGGCIAAKEAATAIRDNDLSCDITIISSEDHLPYYRPMLSRAIGQDLAKSRLYLAPESWYTENNIETFQKYCKMINT